MIYQKRGRWKTSFSSASFVTREEAEDVENKAKGYVAPPPAPEPVEEPAEDWSPLEKLRGWKTCEECNCDPCECEEEWNSVEETSSTTESWMEDHS